MPKTLSFPQYRKYLNNKGYFKVLSEKEWEEIQIIGSKKTLNRFNAIIFPDKNFLYDLTFNYQTNWVKIEEAEYNSILKTITDS